MTTTETLFGDAPIGDNDRLRTQLASVQLLVARSDRDVAHNDIVIATMFEVLEDGPLSRSELFRRVEQAWSLPGASNTLLDEALRHAVLIEHVETRDEHGVEVVHLLDRGRECLAESRRHADDCLCRFRSQLGDELLTRDFYLDAVELESLAAVVLATLRHAIGQALRAQVGLQTAGQRVAVAAPNAASLEAFVSARVPDEDRAALVVALTLVCLDQSRPIGQEIVHQLAKGHLLYRFMARPDLAAAADHAGPLSGVRLIIDTPMLVRMLGPTAVRQPVLALLVEARKQGMEVVIYQRTVDELERLLNRTEDVSAPEWEAAMAKHGIEVALATVLSRVD